MFIGRFSILVSCIIGCCSVYGQDTTLVFSRSNRNKALIHFSIDDLKSSIDTIYLSRKHRHSYSENDALKSADWNLKFKKVIELGTVYKVYYKNRLIEICSGNTEYYTGSYVNFHKKGSIKIKGHSVSLVRKLESGNFLIKRVN